MLTLFPSVLPPSVLLFVFWYCHKRGRETRLAKERALTDAEAAALDEKLASIDTTPPNSADTGPMDLDERVHADGDGDGDEDVEGPEQRKLLTTTAPEGASIEEVKAGMLVKDEQEPAGCAPGGSLARELEREKEEGKGGGGW